LEGKPFIVITGHDLRDLELLLKQTEGQGVDVYTHGEMLPAHGYPGLKKWNHLKGHFGTAWQNQQTEFDNLPGAILFTTNCLRPLKASYADRAFTTGPVAFPGLKHIGADKDFAPVLKKALELGGYGQSQPGGTLRTGFGHGAILSQAGQIVEAVKAGHIRHFFLVGGCDGAKASRDYFRELVSLTPPDTIVLTLACGKFRFNDLDLGTIGGIPRLLDLGQCNDAYGAIKVALALSAAFGVTPNELPLSLVISWYEQKAVSILLTLLYRP
jgi:hydroxylamine reductase